MIDPVRGMVEALLALEDMYNLDGVDDNGEGPDASEVRRIVFRAGEVLHKYRDALTTQPFVKYVQQIQGAAN